MQLISIKSIVRTLAVALAVTVIANVPTAKAGIIVTEDDGGGNGTVAGSSSGTNSLTSSGFLFTYNNATGTFPIGVSGVSFTTATTLFDTAGVLTGSGTKVLSDNLGDTITFNFSINSAQSNVTATAINVLGNITSVVGSSGLVLNGYDFSTFLNAGSTLSLTYTKSNANFLTTLNTDTTVNGVGFGLQQVASVPEPTSVAMLGLGLSGIISLRRFRRKTA